MASSKENGKRTSGGEGSVLRHGALGSDVEALQELLNGQGAGLSVDGRFGPRTERALIQFQERLVAAGFLSPESFARSHGIYDAHTREAAERFRHGSVTASVPSSGTQTLVLSSPGQEMARAQVDKLLQTGEITLPGGSITRKSTPLAGGAEPEGIEPDGLPYDRQAMQVWRQWRQAQSPSAPVLHASPVGHETATVTSSFGEQRAEGAGRKRTTHRHQGVDLVAEGASGRHMPIVASASGVVLFSGRLGSYGQLVVLGHADGTTTRYAHLHARQVAPGDAISAGEPLGRMGRSGRSRGATGVHLHYEQRDGYEQAQTPVIAGHGPLHAGGPDVSFSLSTQAAREDGARILAEAPGAMPPPLVVAQHFRRPGHQR